MSLSQFSKNSATIQAIAAIVVALIAIAPPVWALICKLQTSLYPQTRKKTIMRDRDSINAINS